MRGGGGDDGSGIVRKGGTLVNLVQRWAHLESWGGWGGVPDGGDWTEVRVLRAAHLLVRLGRWGDAFGGTAAAPSPGGHRGNSGDWTRNEDGIGDGKSNKCE